MLRFLFLGMYKGGSFHFSFAIGNEYPHQPPKVRCTQKVVYYGNAVNGVDLSPQYRYSGKHLSQCTSGRLETSSQSECRHLRITSIFPEILTDISIYFLNQTHRIP